MDINSILPLLMKNNGSKSNDPLMPLVAEMLKNNTSGGAKSGANPESDIRETLISSMLKKDGKSPDMSMVLSEMLKNNSKKTATTAAGFLPIIGIVNNDILGRMTKFFSVKK